MNMEKDKIMIMEHNRKTSGMREGTKFIHEIKY